MMFTGLVEKIGKLKSLARVGDGYAIRIMHEPWDVPLSLGESVAVQGACLTVTDSDKDYFAADLLDETLSRTCFAKANPGDLLNLERALTVGDRFGGHMVSGHIDGLGVVNAINNAGRDKILHINCDAEILEYIVEKGSITIDGVSLTVSSVSENDFVVCIIPHTWNQTSLHARKAGDVMNLETDLIAKYVHKYMQKETPESLTIEKLSAAGIV